MGLASYNANMITPTHHQGTANPPRRLGGMARLRMWYEWLMAASMLTVLSLSPKVWMRQSEGRVSSDVVQVCWPLWPVVLVVVGAVFGVVFGLVFETAVPLGLSAMTTELLMRVVILELAPLLVALVVLVKVTLPQISHLRRRFYRPDQSTTAWELGLHIEAMPRLLAGFFAVLLLTLSMFVLLVLLLYFHRYGLNPSGWLGFNQQVGLVLTPAVVFAWVVNLLLSAWCVSLLPMATILVPSMAQQHNADLQLQTLIRVIVMLIVIKLLILTAAYA
jgi:phospholipid/cholesterol/gamma-HCH transport system permease protein